jgi:epsilon-lactone hydrolase
VPSTEHDGLIQALTSAPAGEPTIDQFREIFPGLVSAAGFAPGREPVDEIVGEVPCTRLDGDPVLPLLLWVHGGGLVAGTSGAHTAPLSRLFPDVRVVVVDYRLAPEHPLPAALDDVLAVYRALIATGVGPIVIGGDSAGAGLALLVSTALLEAGDVTPAGLALISPWTDFAVGDGVLDLPGPADPLVSRSALQGMSTAFTSGDTNRWDLVRRDVSGLPPVHIEYGGREVLRADAERLADRLESEGVEVTSVFVGGLVHVYPILLPTSPEGRSAAARLNGFVHNLAGVLS